MPLAQPYQNNQPMPDDWWKQDATLRIQGNIGTTDTGEPLEIFFGVDDNNRPCAHGTLVAMTGAGKTILFHTLITSLTTRYSPSELRLVLMDGKMGVSFNAYRNLPHAEIISLNTPPSLARSILGEVIDEMTARNTLFKKYGVEHFTAYRNMGSPEGPLPRVLMIADEYQVLFEDDDDQEAAQALLKISEQARSAGIHMLLGSQHPAPAFMAYRDLIFSNFHLRMIMKVSQSDVDALLDMSPTTRAIVAATCTQTGRVVVNDHAGDDTKNITGAVTLVDPLQQKNILAVLANNFSPESPKIILDSDEKPLFNKNMAVTALLGANLWDEPRQLEQLAKSSVRSGGLGVADWEESERPIALLLGRQLNVRGQAIAIMTRKRNENLCIIGEHPEERTALLIASLLSYCLQLPPARLEVLIADHRSSDTEWSKALTEFSARAGQSDYLVRHLHSERGAEKIIKAAYNELRWRRYTRVSKRAQLPTLIVIINEPDKFDSLRLREYDYDNEMTVAGKMLAELLEKGAPFGIHICLSFMSLEGLTSIMKVPLMQSRFRHKIALQMSENDSIDFIGSYQAATLQSKNSQSSTAILYDTQLNQRVVFYPFSFVSDYNDARGGQSLSDTIDSVFAHLRLRPHSLPTKSFAKVLIRMLPAPASLSKKR